MHQRHFLTTHSGSLVRPPELREYLYCQRDGREYELESYEKCLRESVAQVVRDQVAAGIDIVGDGEFGKDLSWSSYVYRRLSGLEHRPGAQNARAGSASTSTDHQLFPGFWKDHQAGTPGLDTAAVTGWACTGPISYAGHAALRRDIANLTDALAEVGVAEGFLPAVAPASTVGLTWQDGPYTSEEEFLYAIAEALREEYRMILDAGLLLQVDDAVLPWMYDLRVPPWTMQEYRRWAAIRVEALNHALRGLPAERIRYHICWGSFNAPHVGDVPAADIIDLVLRVNAGAFLIEMANPRHEHEWRLWERAKLPDGAKLVPGVISHATNVVEHPDLVAERLTRLARLVGEDNVIGGTDCGFAQGPLVARVHPEIMWAKLRSLGHGAHGRVPGEPGM